MSDTVFRSITEPQGEPPRMAADEPMTEPNNVGAENNSVEQPLEGETMDQAILNAVGVEDQVRNLTIEDKDNLSEVKGYIKSLLTKKGVTPTASTIAQEMTNLKFQMGLDFNAEPNIVLDRIGGVVKSWKSMAFISDPREKRALFMKLAKLPTSMDMNKAVLEAMEKYQVWR